MDFCWSDTNGFPFIREDSGIHKSMQEIQGGLLRWSFNLADPAPNLAVRGLGPPGDLPRIADADHGRPYTRGWYITVDPQAGPPIPAGPVNAACNLLLRVEPHTGRIDALPLGAGWAFNEPQHVPAKDPAHGGWLLVVVDQQVGEDDFKHALWVLEADAIGKGPIAKVALPFRLRQQVHGWWVPQATLDAAK
jgi:carotenoid cleavage dioxygenase